MERKLEYTSRDRSLTPLQVFQEFNRITFTDPPREIIMEGSFFKLQGGINTYSVSWLDGYWQVWREVSLQ